MKTYTIYTNINDARQAVRRHEKVLVVRRCLKCNDELLGNVIGRHSPYCEEGYCGTRPGVHYVQGQTITL